MQPRAHYGPSSLSDRDVSHYSEHALQLLEQRGKIGYTQ